MAQIRANLNPGMLLFDLPEDASGYYALSVIYLCLQQGIQIYQKFGFPTINYKKQKISIDR
jgi:hypothetical protein